MRLPRHDTSLRLSGETPAEALGRDEALLDSPGIRWWVSSAKAVVVGVALRQRLASVVDVERCQSAGIQVLDRRAGGGALLLDKHMLCGAIAVPTSAISRDITDSYRWLGDVLVVALSSIGVAGRRVEVVEARADVAALRASDGVARIILNTCYGALSPHEVCVDGQKLVGLAQIRRRDTSLFQLGILLRDQSPLVDFLRVSDASTREAVRAALTRRTVGLESLTSRSASEVVAAIVDAMPSAP